MFLSDRDLARSEIGGQNVDASNGTESQCRAMKRPHHEEGDSADRDDGNDGGGGGLCLRMADVGFMSKWFETGAEPPHKTRRTCRNGEGSKTFVRITVGICRKMRLVGFCCLEHTEGNRAEAICAEQYGRFHVPMDFRDVVRLATASVHFSGEDARHAWDTLLAASAFDGSTTVEVISSVPRGHDKGSATAAAASADESAAPAVSALGPIILASMLQYGPARTRPVVSRVGGVGSVYEVAHGRNCSTYLCIQDDADRDARCRESMTLSELALCRERDFSMVHVVVDCSASDAWRYHGLSNGALEAVYSDLRGSGLLDSSACSPSALVGAILPLLHASVCPELDTAIRYPCGRFPVVGMVTFPKPHKKKMMDNDAGVCE